MPVYRWEDDKEQIVARLATRATLKLCVKLLDEPLLIENWIRHHAKIVGFENLIIADNGSTEIGTLGVYAKYADLVTIFQFDGPHNEIHWHSRFAELFAVIRSSCRYFSFVDADERLVFLDGQAWTADSSIVAMIAQIPSDDIIPTTWLINTLNGLDTFSLLDTESRPRLINNLKWGKPILPVDRVGVQAGIHNIQFSHLAFSNEFGTGFFLLHYTQFPERRIAVNRNKLISRGIIDKNVSSNEIPLMSFEGQSDRSFMRFVDEIREMQLIVASGSKKDHHSITDFIKLEAEGILSFSNDDVRRSLLEFLRHGSEIIEATFNPGKEEEGLRDASSLLEAALDFRRHGEGARAERLLRQGLALYPAFPDQYGTPAFRKELMRTYLAQQKWDKAHELVPSQGDPGGKSWHYILFARAFSQMGDTETATKWWKLVLDDDPKRREAQEFFKIV